MVLIDSHAGLLRRDDPRGLALVSAGADLPDDVVGQLDDSLLITGGGYARGHRRLGRHHLAGSRSSTSRTPPPSPPSRADGGAGRL
ncbi:hypothetical protein [Streptomyces broussonetiae]|uniref:Uncharacterized protein n=1 Tax=Streptomyces broussonetiae TaxID=2686304 RepID=A0A6I6N1E0_9ACTN|nr:hypothetical protein [Streptomyces broussonetiae]QHA02655.1 hypothetical protein GQF42_04580 [Streptomyces broussonetiae]